MSSLRSLLSIVFTILATSSVSSSSPVPANTTTTSLALNTTTTSGSSTILTPTLPSTGLSTQLPPPSADLVLKYITVGRGIQNYTCASPSSVPVSTGAVAKLFDITSIAYSPLAAPLLTTLPSSAVDLPISALRIPGINLGLLGRHYFDAEGTPVFDLFNEGERLVAKKVAAVPAPVDASKGPAGTGAVPWLKLGDKGGSVGLKEVYRVVVAGGNSTVTCEKAGVLTVEYAAEYWFYG